MDWPLTGALTGILIAAGAASYGLVSVIQSDPKPASKTSGIAQLVPSSQLPVYALPATPREEFGAPLRPFVSTEPVGPFDVKKASLEVNQGIDVEAPPKRPPSVVVKKAPAAKANQPDQASVAMIPPGPAAVAKPSAPPQATEPDKWRVVATASASYFNLGGHINRSGVVDSLATSHLKDAFKAHRNFPKLPPDIRSHILNTENIDLVKIAPYRGLLGINDKKLEEEQAVRFERVASSR